MDRTQLSRAIYDISHITGTFTLRSGQVSEEYFDKYRFEANPMLLADVAEHMMPHIPGDAEVLAGLEIGGIPIATALSLRSNIPAAFVRKHAKPYGTCRLAEGADIAGKRVCIIEDVVTTGGQILESAAALRERGAIVEGVLCVILRDPRARESLRAAGLAVSALFTMEELQR